MDEGSGRTLAVVGAVIVHDGRVLCAQRGPGGETGGLWEFPGGKTEAGETPRAALAREVAEELGCTVEVGEEVTTTTHAYGFAVIRLTTYWCRLLAGTPEPTEHVALAWRGPDDLADLAWAPADVPAVERVRRRLGR